VLTILNRLVTKGLVERHARGATHTYVPVVSESTVAAGHFEELLDRGADRRAVLQGLVQAISDADAVVLRDLLGQSSSDSKRGDGGSS
jgi:predicted transcriptional regulator